MAKTLTIRLDEATYDVFARAAAAERRPLSNFIEVAALQHIQKDQFVDDAEMAEILGRHDLMRRLKRGSADAKKRRGRFASFLSS